MPHDKNKDFAKWLQAQIALQREKLSMLKDKEQRSIKKGHIALMEEQLRELRKRKK